MPSTGDSRDAMRDNETRDETAQQQTQAQEPHEPEQYMQIDEQSPPEHDDALKRDQQEQSEPSPSESSSMTAMAVSTEIATATETAETGNSVKRPQTDDTTTAEGAALDNGTAGDDSTPPPAKRRALCGVCDTEPSKYKCSRCLLRYCSVACSRIHQENHPPDEPKQEEPKATAAPPAAEAQAQTATPAHPFQVLDDAPELRRLFEKYPRLPARLRTIHDATLPPPNPSAFSHRGGRGGRGGRSGRGARGGRGGFSYTPQPWTKEIGLLQGQKALRRARVDPTEDGDAVRAYCELVTYLLDKGASASSSAAAATATAAAAAAATANNNATAIVRAELEAEGTRVIKQLLDAEGRQ